MKFWEYRAYRLVRLINNVLARLMPNGYSEWFWEEAHESEFIHQDDAYEFVAGNADCSYAR
jgi:hypothetical protein